MARWKDITGQRFGFLLVEAYLGGSRWRCKCTCGGVSTPLTGALTSGNSTSCGCRKRAVLGESTTKHGGHGTRTYRIWKAMRGRCNNANHPRYKDYGGRGIKCDPRWDSYASFRADMGECPAGMTLDRIDNARGYEPGNCRWATYAENNLNKRNTVRVNGVPLKTIAEQGGGNYQRLYKRLQKGSVTAPVGQTLRIEV